MANDLNDALKDFPALSRQYTQTLDTALAPLGLSSSLYYYLLKLHEFGDLPQERLVQLTGVNASNVTRAIAQLVQQDYLTKRKNPKDGRGFVLALTAQGAAICPAILDRLATAQAQFLTPLAPQERNQFVALLQKLAQPAKE